MQSNDNKLIFIVDDEAEIRKILSLHLRPLKNCTFVEASSGKQAFNFLKNHSPDLIITDLKMPKMDGVELLKTCRKNSFYQPILFISAFSDDKRMKEALDFGAYDFLAKPFDREDILNTVKNTLIFSKALSRIIRNSKNLSPEKGEFYAIIDALNSQIDSEEKLTISSIEYLMKAGEYLKIASYDFSQAPVMFRLLKGIESCLQETGLLSINNLIKSLREILIYMRLKPHYINSDNRNLLQHSINAIHTVIEAAYYKNKKLHPDNIHDLEEKINELLISLRKRFFS